MRVCFFVAPPFLSKLRLAPITAGDVDQWAQLARIVSTDDGSRHSWTVTELAERIEPNETFDPAQHTWALWHGEKMVAWQELYPRATPTYDGKNSVWISGGVLPAWRGQGIASYLLQLAEERAREWGREAMPDVPLWFVGGTTDRAPASAELLTTHGYRAVRYWSDMACDLDADYAEDPRTQVLTPEFYEAVRIAHNDAFSTHFGSAPITEEAWARHVSSATFRPDLSRIVVVDGVVLAYAFAATYKPGVMYLNLVGVRGSAQGQGLGRAVLVSSLAAAKAGGFTKAELDVDTENPTQAGRLYSSLGFRDVERSITWEKAAG